ncbi:MAG: hypothetical protein LBU19_07345, partial [Treponema sp.]|nr:hypothetical protein [Treponema sp.]
MASEKKPSIYQDRGTIGSAKELDEYGVWVKSEPQDLVNDDKDTAGDFSLAGLDDLPDFPTDFDASPTPDADSDFSIPEDDFSLDSGGESAAFSFDDQDAGGDFSLSDEDMDLPPPDAAAEEASSKDGGAENPAPDEDDGGFDEISLEDLLDVADELPGEDAGEGEGAPDEDLSKGSADKSTQLLMKIAEELSSIRAELSALKQEFSAVRGTEGDESHGFFNNAGTDDKIALTGDELNNILNTAKFTEESGLNAAEEDQLPGFSEGDAAPADASPETETPAGELSLDDLDIAGESQAEVSTGELGLDDLNITEGPEIEEAELSTVEEPIEIGELSDIGQLD